MTLKELKAKEIIKMVLGDKRVLVKTEEELALLLKKRMTKKELEVLNSKVKGISEEDVMASLKIDASRYETIVSGATKKIKNESVHRDFFNEKTKKNEESSNEKSESV